MPRQPGRFPISIAGLTLVLAGCALTGPTSHDYAPQRTTVLVQNRGWESVQVSVVRAGVPLRIGSVQGLSTRLFVLPPAIMGSGLDLHLRGTRRISGEIFDSQRIDIVPGDRANWVIEPTAAQSYLIVR